MNARIIPILLAALWLVSVPNSALLKSTFHILEDGTVN